MPPVVFGENDPGELYQRRVALPLSCGIHEAQHQCESEITCDFFHGRKINNCLYDLKPMDMPGSLGV